MTRLVAGRWEIQEGALIDFLSSKRWFGDKGRVLRGAEVSDLVPVRWAGSDKEFAVARVRVTTDVGVSTYQLFVLQGEKPADALEDPEFRRGLVDAFAGGAEGGAAFEHAGTQWIIAREGATPLVVPAAAEITLATAEQTNSSVIVDAEAILKLYRRLERGVHPDVEVTRFLSARRFVHVPVLLGTIRFEDKKGITIAGMLQEYVTGAVDGWQYALSQAREYVTRHDSDDTPVPFEDDAEQLGTVTRALHDTLASGETGSGFEYQRASREDVLRWTRDAAATVERALTSLGRALAASTIPKPHVEEARAIVARRDEYLRRISAIANEVGANAGGNTRTHGDFHLGQVLRSATGQFLIIDFEGEPTRPLEERRQRHSPLRDVAGMLRSFAYAAAVASQGSKLGSEPAPADTPGSATRAESWERRAGDAFMRGYFQASDGGVELVPRGDLHADSLIGLFVAEKVFYELQYELDHRPDWVWIPLRGISRLRT